MRTLGEWIGLSLEGLILFKCIFDCDHAGPTQLKERQPTVLWISLPLSLFPHSSSPLAVKPASQECLYVLPAKPQQNNKAKIKHVLTQRKAYHSEEVTVNLHFICAWSISLHTNMCCIYTGLSRVCLLYSGSVGVYWSMVAGERERRGVA